MLFPASLYRVTVPAPPLKLSKAESFNGGAGTVTR